MQWLWWGSGGAGLILAIAAGWECHLKLVLPLMARFAASRGDREAQRKILERISASRALTAGDAKTNARFALAWICMDERDYQGAENWCRKALDARLRPPVEANIRRRLADCLEAMGQSESAKEERRRVEQGLSTATEDAELLLSRGKSLSDAGRHSESYEVYRRALDLISRRQRGRASETMVKLALASYHSGRPDRAVEWSEKALRGVLPNVLRETAHSMAALGSSARGRLDDAERHHRLALSIALRLGDNDRSARSLAQMANVEKLRGDLVGAMAACQRAASLSRRERRTIYIIEGECLRLWGRFDEARAAFDRAGRAPGHSSPAAERRSQGILALGIAWLNAESGHLSQAEDVMEVAKSSFGEDEKLFLWCTSTGAWISALQGNGQEASRLLQEAEARADGYKEDRRTLETCYFLISRAYLAMWLPEKAIEFGRRFLELTPDPVYRPGILYHLGQCAEAMMSSDDARRWYVEAVETGVHVNAARLAAQRLDVIGRDNTDQQTPH